MKKIILLISISILFCFKSYSKATESSKELVSDFLFTKQKNSCILSYMTELESDDKKEENNLILWGDFKVLNIKQKGLSKTAPLFTTGFTQRKNLTENFISQEIDYAFFEFEKCHFEKIGNSECISSKNKEIMRLEQKNHNFSAIYNPKDIFLFLNAIPEMKINIRTKDKKEIKYKLIFKKGEELESLLTMRKYSLCVQSLIKNIREEYINKLLEQNQDNLLEPKNQN